jgi:hypothetical protein
MNKKFLNLILALLIYLPTCAFIPLNLYLVLIIFTLYLNFSHLKNYVLNLLKLKIIDKGLTFLIGFAFFAFVLRVIDYNSWESIKDFYSFGYLFPLTYIVARSINTDVLKYIIYFILIECIVSFAEYLYGTSTFFTSLNLYRVFENYDLLYYTRVFGLSENSSGLSIKLFFGVLILGAVNINLYKRMFIEILFLIASIVVFGRIAMMAILVFYVLKILSSLLQRNKIVFTDYIPIVLFVLFFSVNYSWSIAQFTRNNIEVSEGRISDHGGVVVQADLNKDELGNVSFTENIGIDKIEMSGRNEIWNSYFNFSMKHLYLGNRAKKYMLGSYHAHNSYLEILASFGVILFLGLLSVFAFNISKQNYIYVLAIMFISLGQYAVFWGVSFFDIIFYYLVFYYKSENE